MKKVTVNGINYIPEPKEKTYTITEDQIKELIEKCPSSQCKEEYIRELFPECFKSEVKELVTGWLKHKDGKFPNWLWYVNFDTGQNYGFISNGEFSGSSKNQLEYVQGRCEQATQEEVFEALKNEAVKRGLKQGIMIKSFKEYHGLSTLSEKGFEFNFSKNIMHLGGCEIFKDGLWQTPLETISKEEAEKQLNKKIID